METTSATQTKVCPKCGRELPITEFHKKSVSPDVLQFWCKKCQKESARESYKRNHDSTTPPKKKSHFTQNTELASKQPREIIANIKVLINELRARGYGYEGKLTYLQTINL